MSDDSQRWEQFYRSTHTDNIPWEKAPFPFLEQLTAQGTLTPGTLLDVGCGTGNQSIFFAKQGWTVTGVDISPTAVTEAQQKAEREGVEIHFLVGDATRPSALNLDGPFDVVLDWAVLHGIPATERTRYIEEVAGQVRPGGHEVLRVFSRRDPAFVEGKAESRASGIRYAFSEKEIIELYSPFFIVREHHSRMIESDGKLQYFDEFLMERKS